MLGLEQKLRLKPGMRNYMCQGKRFRDSLTAKESAAGSKQSLKAKKAKLEHLRREAETALAKFNSQQMQKNRLSGLGHDNVKKGQNGSHAPNEPLEGL